MPTVKYGKNKKNQKCIFRSVVVLSLSLYLSIYIVFLSYTEQTYVIPKQPSVRRTTDDFDLYQRLDMCTCVSSFFFAGFGLCYVVVVC